MTALFAGAMVVNDGVSGKDLISVSQIDKSVTDVVPQKPQTPVQPQNTQQSQPADNTQSEDIPLNNVGSGSTPNLHVSEEKYDGIGRSHSTPPVVGSCIFSILEEHQDGLDNKYPNSPNLGNGTRTGASRDIAPNYGNEKRQGMDSYVLGGDSVTENTTGGRIGVEAGGVYGEGNADTDTGYTLGVPPSVFTVTAIVPVDERTRSEESDIIREERNNRKALFDRYAGFFEKITESIDNVINGEMFDRFTFLTELGHQLECFNTSPEPEKDRPIIRFQILGPVYNKVTSETKFMCKLVKEVVQEVNGVINEIWELDMSDVVANKEKLRDIVDVINEKVIINMDPGHLLKGLNFKPSNDESKDDYIIASIQIDDEGFVAIPVDRFRDYFASIVNVLDEDRKLNVGLNIVNMATNIVTKVRDRERVLLGHDCLVYSYAYILQKYFLDFFENVLKSKESLSGIVDGITQTQNEQLKLLSNLEARICERNRNNPERIENMVMNEVFNVVSRRIEREEARIRAENVQNDPEVYPIGAIMYSRGTLDNAKNELVRIYQSIDDKQKKINAYTAFGRVIESLKSLEYENAAEAGAKWAKLLSDINRLVLRSGKIKDKFKETNNQFLRDNLRL